MPHFQKDQNEKKQRSIVVFFAFLISIVFVIVYFRIYVRGDYMLFSEVECDPAEEACFVRECEEDCDPKSPEEYYKTRSVSAAFVSTCNPTVEECSDQLCSEIPTCVEHLCIDESVPEGEWCNDPQVYRDSMNFSDEDPEELDGRTNEIGE